MPRRCERCPQTLPADAHVLRRLCDTCRRESSLEANRKSNSKYRARKLKVNRAPRVSRSESERAGRLEREARQQAEAEAADARRAEEQIESLASLWALQGFEVEP